MRRVFFGHLILSECWAGLSARWKGKVLSESVVSMALCYR